MLKERTSINLALTSHGSWVAGPLQGLTGPPETDRPWRPGSSDMMGVTQKSETGHCGEVRSQGQTILLGVKVTKPCMAVGTALQCLTQVSVQPKLTLRVPCSNSLEIRGGPRSQVHPTTRQVGTDTRVAMAPESCICENYFVFHNNQYFFFSF